MTTGFQHAIQTVPLQVAFELTVVSIPDDVKSHALAKAKEAYVMALLEAGEISSGKAASLMSISRTEMIQWAGQCGISLFDDSLDIEALQQEVAQTNESLEQQSA